MASTFLPSRNRARLGGADERANLPERRDDREDPAGGHAADDQVEDARRDDDEDGTGPNRRHEQRADDRQRGDRKGDVPGASVDRIRLGQPPQVVAGRIAQARERSLHTIPRLRIVTHAVDE